MNYRSFSILLFGKWIVVMTRQEYEWFGVVWLFWWPTLSDVKHSLPRWLIFNLKAFLNMFIFLFKRQ